MAKNLQTQFHHRYLLKAYCLKQLDLINTLKHYSNALKELEHSNTLMDNGFSSNILHSFTLKQTI